MTPQEELDAKVTSFLHAYCAALLLSLASLVIWFLTPLQKTRQIVEQGNLVRSLKSQNPVDKDAIAEQVALLKQLKAEKDANSPSTVPKSASDEKEGKADSKKGKGGGYTLKVPKVNFTFLYLK